MRHSRQGAVGLLGRHLRTATAPALVLAALVLIASAVLAAFPGTLAGIGGAQLRYEVGGLSPDQRFLTTKGFGSPDLGPAPPGSVSALPAASTSAWGAFDFGLAQVRNKAPGQLRDHLGRARYTAYSSVLPLPQPPVEAGVSGEFRLILAADPQLGASARLASGQWPAPRPKGSPVAITLSVATAARMGWRVGETRSPTDGPTPGAGAQLTGTFQAAPDSGDFWALNPSILLPHIQPTTNSDIVTGTAFLDAGSWGTAALVVDDHLQIYYPFDVEGVAVSDADALRAQLEQFTNGPHPVAAASVGRLSSIRLSSIRLGTASTAVLTSALTGIGSADVVLSVLAVGPCGAALAVLLLGCRLLAARRRSALVLLGARGASTASLRGVLLIEGLVLAVPPAAAGVFLAFALLPPDAVVPALALPAVAALLPAAVLCGPVGAPGAVRDDLSVRRRGRVGGIGELIVIFLAVASTLLLYRTQVGVRAGLDPLVLLAPLLISLAACVVVGRVFPLPLMLLHRVFRRRSGLVGFLGSARSLRERTVGLAQTLAVLLGIAMAVLSSVLLSTVRHGVESASRMQVGADLRVNSNWFLPEQVAAAGKVGGVRSLATSMTVSGVQLTISGLPGTVPIYVVDATKLGGVQAGVEGAAPVPSSMTGASGGAAVPVVVSAGLAGAATLSINGRPLAVVGVGTAATGLGAGTDWIIMDKAMLGAVTSGPYLPEELLLQLAPGADAAAVQRGITQALPDAVITSSGGLAAALVGAPINAGLQGTMVAALGLMAALCLAAVVMTAVANAPARARYLAVLRILGLRPGAARAVVGWELAPTATAALIGGVVVGGGLCRVVTDVVDLRRFTGGVQAPPISLDPVLLGALTGGFVLVVAGAIGLAAVVSRRAGPAGLVGFGD